MSHLAALLRDKVQRRRLSNSYLAMLLDTDETHVRRMLSGEKRPSDWMLIKWSQALLSCPEFVEGHSDDVHLLGKLMAAKLCDAADDSLSGRKRPTR